MEAVEIIKTINKLRLSNKDKWVIYTQNGIQYKAFNCWVQILKIGSDPTNHTSNMGLNVKEFKAHLVEAFKYAENNK